MNHFEQIKRNCDLPPLSLYVHIPWCVKKCPYCDFNSHAKGNQLPIREYVNALINDLTLDAKYAQGRKLQSIFFGGGTPSLFPGAAIGEVIEHARQLFDFQDGIEITLEANPGTTEQGNFVEFLKAGVNRLSVGVQSFNDQHLATLGRIHDGHAASQAIKTAHDAGFDNINIDLMHGLPHQRAEEALTDIETALALGVKHLSWYQLTIEANTAFFSSPPLLPNENQLWRIQETGLAYLRQHQFDRYEVSAYSLDSYSSKHNMNYWAFGDYIGIGAGAHGKLTTRDGVMRNNKTRQPQDYLARNQQADKNFTTAIQPIDKALLAMEFMMNALRLKRGVPTSLFESRTGIPLCEIEPVLKQLVQKALLHDYTLQLHTTDKGFNFLDDVVSAFLPSKPTEC